MSIAKKFQDFLHEETSEKRYVVNMEFYIWAKDDEKAIKQAKNIAYLMDKQEDNKASIISLYEQPFGTLTNKKIFDNK